MDQGWVAADRAVEALALFAAVQATFSDVHPYVDLVVQNDADARGKGLPGWKGRKHCARHVFSYSIGQFTAAVAVTRSLGFRTPIHALLAGTAITAVTHYVIDRRDPLWTFLRSRLARHLRLVGEGKAQYAEFAVVQRGESVIDSAGPGTAIMELDAAAHRLIGVIASVTTTLLAVRSRTRAATS